MKFIGKAFSVKIDNPTRTFQEICNRKISTTLYLDDLKAKFLSRIDQNEERDMKRKNTSGARRK